MRAEQQSETLLRIESWTSLLLFCLCFLSFYCGFMLFDLVCLCDLTIIYICHYLVFFGIITYQPSRTSPEESQVHRYPFKQII